MPSVPRERSKKRKRLREIYNKVLKEDLSFAISFGYLCHFTLAICIVIEWNEHSTEPVPFIFQKLQLMFGLFSIIFEFVYCLLLFLNIYQFFKLVSSLFRLDLLVAYRCFFCCMTSYKFVFHFLTFSSSRKRRFILFSFSIISATLSRKSLKGCILPWNPF